MTTHVTVERQLSKTSTTAMRWRFYFRDGRIVLDRFELLRRQSSRHKFRVDKFYTRLESHKSTVILDEVPWPQDVQNEAYYAFTDQITVVKQVD